MLAESIGAEVEWDNATRSVHITTSDSVDKVGVQSLTASENVVDSGDKVELTAVANSSTSKVRFADASTDEQIAEVTDYTQNADGTRTFVASYTASNTTDEAAIKQIKAVPGTKNSYSTSSDAIRSVALVVNVEDKKSSSSSSSKGYQSDYMISCELDDTDVVKGDYAYVTVVTTDDVDKIKISSSNGSDSTTVSKYDEDDDERTFSGKVKMTNRGSVSLYVYLYVDGEFESEYETLTVRVTNSGSSSDDDDELDINDVECVQDKVYKGENAHVVVKTPLGVSQIVIFDDDDKKVAKETSYSTKDDDELTWDLTFEMTSSATERFTVTAYNDDGESVDETIRIKGKTYSKNSDVCALAVTQKSNSVKEGDSCKITIKATSSVSYVEIYDDDDDLIDTVTSSSKSSSFKTFTYTIDDIDDINDIYEAVVYGTDGESDSIRFKLIGESVEDVEINEVKVEDSTVSLDDEINITVYTNTAVTKVWVEGEDDDGEQRRVSKKMTKPTSEGKSELTWKLDFDPEEKGRFTYTVVASDDDDNTDTQTIRITVTK
jgi:hypothetical protein